VLDFSSLRPKKRLEQGSWGRILYRASREPVYPRHNQKIQTEWSKISHVGLSRMMGAVISVLSCLPANHYESRSLWRFGRGERRKCGQRECSNWVIWFERGKQQGSSFLVELRLRRPGDFWAHLAGEFSERDGSIAVGISLSSESFQEVVGEEAMAVLVVFQPLR